MTELLVYGGVTLVIVGCLIVIIGAVRYAAGRRNGTETLNSHATARLRFARCRLAWMILSLAGILLVVLAGVIG